MAVFVYFTKLRSGLSLHLEIVRQDRSSPYCEQVFGYCSVPLWFGGLLLLKSQQQCVSGAEHVFEQLSLPVMLPTYCFLKPPMKGDCQNRAKQRDKGNGTLPWRNHSQSRKTLRTDSCRNL